MVLYTLYFCCSSAILILHLVALLYILLHWLHLLTYCLRAVYMSVYTFITTCLYLYTPQHTYLIYQLFISCTHHSMYLSNTEYIFMCIPVYNLFSLYMFSTLLHNLFKLVLYILLILTWLPQYYIRFHILFYIMSLYSCCPRVNVFYTYCTIIIFANNCFKVIVLHMKKKVLDL